MVTLLKKINLDHEEIEWLNDYLLDIGVSKVENFINLLIDKGCHYDFIKEILFNHREVIKIDLERISYIIEAILSNGDIIEETLLELV